MIDWEAIRVQYITDPEASYRKLAEKNGVSYQAICHRSKVEGWIARREQHLNETTSKTLDKISQQKANRAAKIQSVADKMLTKIETIVDRPGTLLPKDLRALVAAVKDLKEIQSIKSDLDEKEQKARIANLEKSSKPEAKDTATLIVEGLPEEFKV